MPAIGNEYVQQYPLLKQDSKLQFYYSKLFENRKPVFFSRPRLVMRMLRKSASGNWTENQIFQI
jgi:hypothetical protein